MHAKFLDLFCCPETRKALTLDAQVTLQNGIVWAGTLRSPSGRQYPIVRGVPRFVDREHYAASFGWEWTRWPRVQFDSENVGRPMAGHTTRMWERITGAAVEDVTGKTVVDFGCGPGRFLDVVRRKGGIAVGIDLSQAVDAARTNFGDDPDVLIVQGDLLRPPFREGAFDGGFSIGVLHHTPGARGRACRAGALRAARRVGVVLRLPEGRISTTSRPSAASAGIHAQAIAGDFEYLPALAYSHLAAYVHRAGVPSAEARRPAAASVEYVERQLARVAVAEGRPLARARHVRRHHARDRLDAHGGGSGRVDGGGGVRVGAATRLVRPRPSRYASEAASSSDDAEDEVVRRHEAAVAAVSGGNGRRETTRPTCFR